jgi:hypothetical protein
MYLLQWKKDYQRFEWNHAKPWRIWARHRLLREGVGATMMVQESYFDYYSYTISLTSPTSFTIKDLKTLIQQKVTAIKHKEWWREIVYHYIIGHCMVEYEPALHVLWKSWNLSFVLNIVVLQHMHVLELKKHCLPSTITIIPKHLWMVLRLGSTMQWPVSVLHFMENEIVVLWCQDGWYTSIDTAPFGLSLLYASLKDHDIAAYLYNDIDRLEKNMLLRKTVEEAFTFFLKQCVSRMHQQSVFWKPCILLCPFAKHPVFIEILELLSSKYHTAWFLPFSGKMIGVEGSSDERVLVQARIQKIKK